MGLVEIFEVNVQALGINIRNQSIIQHASISGNPSDQRGALNITRESKNFLPLVHHEFDGRNLSPFNQGIQQLKIIYSYRTNIWYRKQGET